MSFFAFIIRALAISPFVFLRYIPTFVLYVLLVVGVFLSTDNPWVIGLVMLVLGSVGFGFLVVTGIRSGLMTLRVTTAPEVEKLLYTSVKLLFGHLLIQLIIAAALGALVFAGFYNIVLPSMAPALVTAIDGLWAGEPVFISQSALEQARLPYFLFSLSMLLVGGICVGLFGVPMAAVSANAVQHSPNNDMIYGLGRYLPHQVALYLIAMLIPAAIYAFLLPASALLPSGSALPTLGVMTVALALYSIYAPCISYAGMALGYSLVREELARSRQAEALPEIDYEAERENLRELRQVRTSGAKGARVYNPHAAQRELKSQASEG